MERKPYPSDLTDEQWQVVESALPPAKGGRTGRPRQVPLREICNAIFYQTRTGCPWRYLPHDLPPWEHDLPPWKLVWEHFSRWRDAGLIAAVHDALREKVRVQAGHDPTPSAAILGSQWVKTTQKGGCGGVDVHKQVKGRKRHLAVDTLGLIIAVVVHCAGIQDRDGAKRVIENLKGRFPRLPLIWADSAYRAVVGGVCSFAGWVLQVVKRPSDAQGFVLLPRRFVTERTFGWLMKFRRLSRDYEETSQSSEAWIRIAMIHSMTRRLAPSTA